MDTTLNPKQTDPRHVLAARADAELAHAHEQITRADEQIARTEQQLSKLEHDAARRRLRGNRGSRRGQAVRAFTGLILAASICVAAIVWQSSHGGAARQIVAMWAPQLFATSSWPLETPGPPAQSAPPAVQAATVKPASSQPAPPVQATPDDPMPTVAPLTQLLQSMARDLATIGQGIEQLKAGQEQIARDNANAVGQLKAGQEQMARVIARVSEQNLRPRVPTPSPSPLAAATRKPAPALRSP
jgi:hypothetical protein